MTLRMGDAIYPAEIPQGLTAVAGYVDGRWPSFSELELLFPAVPHRLSITVNGQDAADCIDVENGDATITDVPAFLARGGWAVYTSVANVEALIARVPRTSFKLWTAHYTAGQHICTTGTCRYPGLTTAADGTQWIDHGTWDESLLTTYFFTSIPAPPTPVPVVPVIYPEDHMQVIPGVTVQIGATGNGWFPSPVPAAQVTNVVFYTENPEVVHRYDSPPTSWAVASQVGPNSPNGVITVKGPAAGTFGCEVWAVTG